MRARGFSLLEAIVVLGLFGLVVGGVFAFFRMGTRGFYSAISKTGTVGELQRMTRVLRRDIQLSHFYSISTHFREVTLDDTYRRDALCVAGLSNWKDEESFEVGTGLPKWDRWVVFSVTDEGNFVRSETERTPWSPGQYYPIEPMEDLPEFLEAGSSSRLRVSQLGVGVREFSSELDFEKRLVNVQIVLEGKPGRRMTSEETTRDVLEAQYEIYPLNSYPEL
jgi:hypothetical protein